MSLGTFTAAWKTRGITPVEKLALLYIAEAAGMDIWPPDVEALAAFCGCSIREAHHALLGLKRDGYAVLRDSEHGRGRGYSVVTER